MGEDCCTGAEGSWNSFHNKCYSTLKTRQSTKTYSQNDQDDLSTSPDADDVCRTCCNQDLAAGEPGSCDTLGTGNSVVPIGGTELVDSKGVPLYRCGTTGDPTKERTFPATCYKGIRKRSRVCCTKRHQTVGGVITGCQEDSLAEGYCQHTFDDDGTFEGVSYTDLVTGQTSAAGTVSHCNRWYYTDLNNAQSIVRDTTIT